MDTFIEKRDKLINKLNSKNIMSKDDMKINDKRIDLMKEYCDLQLKLKLICEKYENDVCCIYRLKQFQWCNECDKYDKAIKLIDINMLSYCHDAMCIDNKYISLEENLTFMCIKYGHTWLISWKLQKKITDIYCKICKNNEHVHKIARSIIQNHEGSMYEFDDESELTMQSNCTFTCKYRHSWVIKMSTIFRKKSWWGQCHIFISEAIVREIMCILFQDKFVKAKPSWLKGLELNCYLQNKKLAVEYDDEYNTDLKKIQERDRKKDKLCKKNNVILLRVPYTFKYDNMKDYIVNLCNKNKIIIPNNIDIDYKEFKNIYIQNDDKYKKVKKIIEKKGGELLTDIYISNKHPMLVVCKDDHKFMSNYSRLVHNRSYCKKCTDNGNKKYTIEDMKQLAKDNDSKCLSDKYVNVRSPLLWKCHCGNEWYCTKKSIDNNGGKLHCLKCIGYKNRKYTIQDIHDYAEKNEGKFLSTPKTEYVSMSDKFKFRCEANHVFECSLYSLFRKDRKQFCTVCVRTKLTIQDMKNYAKKKGGRCLSTVYVNSKTKLWWSCDKNHKKYKWESNYDNIKKIGWCKMCKKLLKKKEKKSKSKKKSKSLK